MQQDRRVRRSRAALMAAAVRLVSERGATAIAVTDLTEAADVSRKLLYMHFGDRDGLLVAAAVDLVERELLAQPAPEDLRSRMLALARHFAEHRAFYRPMLTGSCAFAMARAMNGLYSSLTRSTLDDLAVFFASGATGLLNEWLIDGADPLDPDDLADRLLRLAAVFAPPTDSTGGGRAR
jgi:AcrR family transcriptional regulator